MKIKNTGQNTWEVTFPTHAASVQARGHLKSSSFLSTDDELKDFATTHIGKLWIVEMTMTGERLYKVAGTTYSTDTLKQTKLVSTKMPQQNGDYLAICCMRNGHRVTQIVPIKDVAYLTVREVCIAIKRKRTSPVPVPFDNDVPVTFEYKAVIRDERDESNGDDIFGILSEQIASELEESGDDD